VALAHAVPPVEWLMAMESNLGRQLCLGLCQTLVELEAVSVTHQPAARVWGNVSSRH
jgi:hypothetical protein